MVGQGAAQNILWVILEGVFAHVLIEMLLGLLHRWQFDLLLMKITGFT